MSRTEYERCVAELEALYAELPALNCKGRCANSCTTTDAVQLEHHRIREVSGIVLPPPIGLRRLRALIDAGKRPRCPALGSLNTCRVYEHRPLMCRAFGSVDVMACEFGCEPERYLTMQEFVDLVRRAREISRRAMAARGLERKA